MTLRITLAMAYALTCTNALAQAANSLNPTVAANTLFELRQSNEITSVATPPPSVPETRELPRAVDAALLPSALPESTGLPTEANSDLPVIEMNAPAYSSEAVDLISEADDVFQRMRTGFSMPDINSDLVLYHQQWYLNRPDYLRRMVERSSLYLHFIVEELDRRDMPMELALLPMVESAYNPMAYSRAKASGLWQFIPATGKRFKLDQDWWKDERRDIVASTSAALDYLQAIYEMHGDWHLALASYNWGEGAVGRALNKNRALGLPGDYMSLTMPRETQNYVPKLQALKNIFSNPNILAELNIPRIPNRPYFGTITKTANIDIKVAARLAEMPVHQFIALNPSHNRPVIKSDTPMVIPADKVDAFVSNLEAHEESKKPLSSWQSYTMRPGDKLEMIAPRFGMSVANLKAVNGIKGRLKVTPGFTLLVAGKDGGTPLDMAALPEQPRLPDADPTPASKGNAAGRSHLVRKGDTSPAIAKRYGISVAELKRLNHLQGDKLKPGMRLALESTAKTQVTNSAKAAKAPAAPVQSAKQDKKAQRVTQYTIRLGDTLASIARQFRVAANDLMRWNNVTPKTLKPGKTLTIQLAQNP
ncbi:MAG: LysM peptidoglycan-binding domain-containing protein [Betaproteobacteria bacterium]